jgi:hypothetical protein
MALALGLPGCFAPKYGNGHLKCADGQACPDGYHCATDSTCWKNGSDPSSNEDMSSFDMGADMALPPPLSYPPAAVWISSGGGVLLQPGVAEIGMTVCGEFAVGTAATTANPSTITFGYFSSVTN